MQRYSFQNSFLGLMRVKDFEVSQFRFLVDISRFVKAMGWTSASHCYPPGLFLKGCSALTSVCPTQAHSAGKKVSDPQGIVVRQLRLQLTLLDWIKHDYFLQVCLHSLCTRHCSNNCFTNINSFKSLKNPMR